MLSLSQGGRHRKAQALPLPRMKRSQTRDSRSFQEAGAKSKNLKEGVEVAKWYCWTSSQWKSMEQGPFQYEGVGV